VVLTPLLGVRRPGPRPWRHRLPSLPAPSRAGSGPTTLPPLRQTRSATPRGAVVNLHGFPELGEVYVGGTFGSTVLLWPGSLTRLSIFIVRVVVTMAP
jgi:hypothetical protein